jgi:hypothetical protein
MYFIWLHIPHYVVSDVNLLTVASKWLTLEKKLAASMLLFIGLSADSINFVLRNSLP